MSKTVEFVLNIDVNKSIASMSAMKSEMKEVSKAMQEAANAGNSEAYNKLSQRFIELRDNAEDLNAKLQPMDKQIGTLTKTVGTLTQVGTSLSVMFGADSKSAEELFKTFAKAQAVTQVVSGFNELVDQAPKVVAAAKAMGAAMYTSLGPWGLLAAAIAAVVVGVGIYIYSNQELTESEADKATAIANSAKATEEANKSAAKEIATTRMLLTEIGKENTSRKDRQKGINELEKSYPGVLDKMTKEKLLAGDIGNATKLLTQEIYNKAKAKAYEGIVEEAVEKQLTALQKAREIRALAQNPKKAEALLKAQSGALGILIPLIDEYLPSLGLEGTLTRGLVDANEDLKRANRDVNIALAQASSSYSTLKGKKDDDTDATKKNTKALKENKEVVEKEIEINDNLIKKTEDWYIKVWQLRNKGIRESIDRQKESQELNKQFYQTDLQNSIDALNKKMALELDNVALLEADKLEIKKRYADETTKLQEDAAKKQLEININYGIQSVQSIMNVMGAINENIQQGYSQQEDTITKSYDAQIKVAEDAGQDTTYIEAAKQQELSRLKKEAGEKEKKYSIAQVWVNAASAVLANLASYSELGPWGTAAAIVVNAGILATAAVQANTISQQQFAKGGYVQGTGNEDNVHAMLTPGEFVIKKDVVQQINSGQIIDYNKLSSLINDKKVINVASETQAINNNNNRILNRAQFTK